MTMLDHARIVAFLLLVLTSIGVLPIPQGTRTLELADDGAWCWFQDPRAVYVAGAHARTYACWVTSRGALLIGAFDHATGAIERYTLKDSWGADDHNTGSLLVLPDHRLMVFYARHNEPGLYCRRTVRPEDITAWDDEVTVTSMPRVTYSHPAFLDAEQRCFVFWRGESWKPTFATSKDGISWSAPRILVQEPGREGADIRPYLKVVSDGKRTIHLAFTDGHPRDEAYNAIHYLRYEAGRFTRADGTLVGREQEVPLAASRCDLVYDARVTGVRAWVWDCAVDSTGWPAIAYTRLPSETDHRYHVARWTGTRWDDAEVTPGGGWFPQTPHGTKEFETHYSGGITLRPGRTTTVYLSRPFDGRFRIERWDQDRTRGSWAMTTLISDTLSLNVRPVVPAGYEGVEDHVLWMHGAYTHYTNFATHLMMMVPIAYHR